MIDAFAKSERLGSSLPEALLKDAGEVGEINSPKILRELLVLLENLPEQIGEFDWLDSLPEEITEQKPEKASTYFNEFETAKMVDNVDRSLVKEIYADIPSKASGDGCNSEIGETVRKGGSYKDVYKDGEGTRYEIHHMPADSVSSLERNDGPAIKMEKGDHRVTASCGSSREAQEYRIEQAGLIGQGRFRDAVQMDIDDIRDKFRDKYDDAIEEMLEYVNKLEKEGKIGV